MTQPPSHNPSGSRPVTDPAALDYGMLTHQDLINIVLQRSEVLAAEPKPAAVIKAWEAGDAARLNEIVQRDGADIARRAVQVIYEEFQGLIPVLDRIRPKQIADIGCGYAFFDLFLHQRYGCELLLIDVEENEHRHFGFEQEGAAYTNLQTGRAFLTANGVDAAQITTWNPEKEELDDTQPVDLAFSFLSCGFHYPVDMYMPFFRFGVAPGGSVLLDIRGHQFQAEKRVLKRLGQIEILSQGRGGKRIWLRKGRRS